MKERNNDKLCLAIALAGLVVGLSACSHNTAGITVGTRVNAGLDPQNATANISYSDGLNVVDVSRENSTWQLEVDGDAGLSYDEQSGSVKGVRKIRRSIGPQITGYLVDLSERNPEAALEYVKAMRAYWEAEAAKTQETATEDAQAEVDQTASGPTALDELRSMESSSAPLDDQTASGLEQSPDGDQTATGLDAAIE